MGLLTFLPLSNLLFLCSFLTIAGRRFYVIAIIAIRSIPVVLSVLPPLISRLYQLSTSGPVNISTFLILTTLLQYLLPYKLYRTQ